MNKFKEEPAIAGFSFSGIFTYFQYGKQQQDGAMNHKIFRGEYDPQ
ncbi:hypothetical protein [Niabella ginsenosidivorans]|nr:hypothetical protein [Niabella ginsenosidivorans]